MMQFKRKILITGAAGFIGSSLVEHLLKDGQSSETLRLLVAPWDNLDNLPQNIFEIVICDIRDKKLVDKAMRGIDTVYHLAAKTVKRGGTYEYYKDTNVNGTENLLEAAGKHQVKKFIYFSSISVFGLPAWSGDIKGCNETWPKNFSEPYGRTKYESEKLVINASKKFGLDYIILRPTTVYGPKDKAGIFQLFKVIKEGHFIFIGNARNKMDYVYVGDIVKAARMAEKSSISNEDFIIGGGKPIQQIELVASICKSIHKDIPKIYIPKYLALPLSKIIVQICNLFDIKPLLFPERVKILTTDCYFDIQKAKNVLGYRPEYSIHQGAYLTADWLIRNNYI